METHIYYFDFESILAVKHDITPEEESFAERYLDDLIVEIDEDSEQFPLTAEKLRYLIVHIVRYHENFNI